MTHPLLPCMSAFWAFATWQLMTRRGPIVGVDWKSPAWFQSDTLDFWRTSVAATSTLSSLSLGYGVLGLRARRDQFLAGKMRRRKFMLLDCTLKIDAEERKD